MKGFGEGKEWCRLQTLVLLRDCVCFVVGEPRTDGVRRTFTCKGLGAFKISCTVAWDSSHATAA